MAPQNRFGNKFQKAPATTGRISNIAGKPDAGAPPSLPRREGGRGDELKGSIIRNRPFTKLSAKRSPTGAPGTKPTQREETKPKKIDSPENPPYIPLLKEN